MRIFLAISLGAALLVLGSCDRPGKTSASKTPATPKPAATVAQAPPPAPAPPISIPQTEVQLPPAQPVSQAALATIQAPQEPAVPEAPEPEPAAKPPARRQSAAGPKPESPPPATTEVPAVQPPAAPAEERPRLQPVYSDEERRKILSEIERRKVEIENILKGINQNHIASNQNGVIESIHSFLSVSDDAAKRGDLRSADSLSDRALILARELASGR